jgi:hypothetical protein
VQDQDAGKPGKCPVCGMAFMFPGGPAPHVPLEPFAVHPPPSVPPAFPEVGAAAPGFSSAGAAAPPRPFSLAGLDQITSITLPIGLFFLFLLALSTLLPWVRLPWISGEMRSFSGLNLARGTLLLLLCLMVGTLAAATIYFKENARRSAVVGAGFGTFAFFVMIGELSRASRTGGSSVGLWLGLVAALGIIAPFIVLGVQRPLDWAHLKTLNLPPIIQRFGALAASLVGALLLGFLYLVLALAAPAGGIA